MHFRSEVEKEDGYKNRLGIFVIEVLSSGSTQNVNQIQSEEQEEDFSESFSDSCFTNNEKNMLNPNTAIRSSESETNMDERSYSFKMADFVAFGTNNVNES